MRLVGDGYLPVSLFLTCDGGVTIMRKDGPIAWKLVLWSGAIVVLCGLVPGPAVAGVLQTAPDLAVPAAALGLTLITAANRDRD